MVKQVYTGKLERTDDPTGGKIVVGLPGWLNKCDVICLKFSVQLGGLGAQQNNPLSSCPFGYLVLTASAGIMDCEKVREDTQEARSWGSSSRLSKMGTLIIRSNPETGG